MNSSDFFSTRRIRYNASSAKVQTCSQCGLWRGKINPRQKPYGNFKLGILNIGEAPGQKEDERGKPWQGQMGQVLQHAYKKFGINLFKDCVNINSCRCRPTTSTGANRAPTDKEISNCRQSIFNTINEYKPKVIMLLGNAALKSVIGSRWHKDLGPQSRWIDWAIPDRDLNCWIYPTYHPSFTERGDVEVETIWMQHLERGLNLINKKLPVFKDERKQVIIVDRLKDVRDKIHSPFAVDYETTGLKPHDTTAHDIICGSIYCGELAYTFLMTPENRKFLVSLLESNEYQKIAANLKYEHTWSRVILKAKVRGWLWDTMLAAHVLDNRRGSNGLKFLVYTNFGVIDYTNKIDGYLESEDKKNANSVNRIRELIKTEQGKQDLLTYCGLDTIYEYHLARIQMKQLKMESWKEMRAL
jgi:uracil-DNA glycosylase